MVIKNTCKVWDVKVLPNSQESDYVLFVLNTKMVKSLKQVKILYEKSKNFFPQN